MSNVSLGSWEPLLEKYIGQAVNLPNIGVLAGQLMSMLISNINASPLTAAQKNAIINGVAMSVVSETHARVSASAMRPSIFQQIGGSGEIDLAILHDKGGSVKKSAVYYNPETKDFIPIGRLQGWAHKAAGNYFQRTATQFMAAHPECVVTIN